MTKTVFSETPNAIGAHTWAVVACVLAAFFVFFVMRGVGLEPIVFADEWLHSVSARLVKLSDAYSPSYLYYYLYRPTRGCGFAFLECARLANIGVFLVAGFLFFLYALRFVSTTFAVLMLAVFLGAPSNIYVLLFSPDALFYAGFGVFFMSLLLFVDPWRAATSGFLLGLLALIKINAIFLAPGIALFFLIEFWLKRRRFADLTVTVVLFAAVFLIAKMGVGYLIAGPNGLSIGGQLYYTQVASGGLDLSTILGRLPSFFFSVSGYLSTVVLLLAMPIVSLFLAKRLASPAPDRMLGYAAVSILLPSLVIFGLFAAMVSDTGPYESIRRLSLRYFSFLFPFFYLFGLSILAGLNLAEAASVRAKIASALGLAATAITVFVIPHAYAPNLPDSPELMFLTFSPASMIAGVLLLLLPLLVLLLRPALAARSYLVSLLLLSLVCNIVTMSNLRLLRTPSSSDAAGRYAALFLGPERPNVAVLGSNLGDLYRTMFHLNAVGPIGITLTSSLPREELLKLLQSKKWVLLLGPEALRLAPPQTSAPAGFALVPSEAVVRQVSED